MSFFFRSPRNSCPRSGLQYFKGYPTDRKVCRFGRWSTGSLLPTVAAYAQRSKGRQRYELITLSPKILSLFIFAGVARAASTTDQKVKSMDQKPNELAAKDSHGKK